MNVPPSQYMVSIFDGFDGPEGVPTPTGPEDSSVTVPPVLESVPCLSYLHSRLGSPCDSGVCGRLH